MRIAGLEVDFYYEEPKQCRRRTFCIIDREGGPVEGIAVCKNGDIYSRRKGRRQAFENAIRNVFSREDREKLWASYFEKFPNDKQRK